MHTQTLRWEGELPPGHTRHNGVLHLGGVDARELGATYGTPLLVLDERVFLGAVEQITDAAGQFGIEVAYGGKALLLVALARCLIDQPISIDVCSLGELLTVERAGFPRARITFHGCAKTDEELRAISQGRVGTVVVDNLDELGGLARSGLPDGCDLILRINTGIEAHTHAFVQTGGDDTKFGIAAHDFARTAQVIKTNEMHFAGLHSHIGSQIFEGSAYSVNLRKLLEAAAQFSAWDLPCERIIVGGGFGVETGPHDAQTLDVPTLLQDVYAQSVQFCETLQIPPVRLGIEPGRALIARAGTSLYRVMARKDQTTQTFLIVDGSIADNPRPAIYDAYHHALAICEMDASNRTHMMICGRSCENDRLTEAPMPNAIRTGDYIALCTTGAYTYSMASNYNRFARPAVVMVRDGKARLIAKRESTEDVLRNDLD